MRGSRRVVLTSASGLELLAQKIAAAEQQLEHAWGVRAGTWGRQLDRIGRTSAACRAGFPAVPGGQATLVPTPEPGADRHIWRTRLAAALEGELASRPVESLGDLLRVGEQLLTATLREVAAGSDPARDAETAEIAARLARARESVAAARTAWNSATTIGSRGQPVGSIATSSRTAPLTRMMGWASGRVVPPRATALQIQGAYYVISGLWAVVDRRGFETVSGRKTDYWLVRMVGLLAAAIGVSLLAGTRDARPSSETKVLGVAAGVSFTAVDLVYVARRRISPVYLGDAVVHVLLAAFALLRSREPKS